MVPNAQSTNNISLRRLYWAVFLCGAVVMILELVGTRIVAPFLGSTIYVWTSLIGTILASLSAGYWYGGKRADLKPASRELAKIIFLAAIFIAMLAVIKYPVLLAINYYVADIRLASLIGSIILFALPTFLLGMVSPYAVKLSIGDLVHSGAAVGRLYAVSTLGSILGTFLGGFFLISWIGNTMLLVILGMVLIIAAWIVAGVGLARQSITALVLMGLLVPGILHLKKLDEQHGIFDLDTQYQRLRVIEHKVAPGNRLVRMLLTDAGAVQAMMYVGSPDEIAAPYIRFYRLAHHFVPEAKAALMVGGGGYSAPRDFLATYPLATMDVVEIDPQVTQVARDHFNLKDDPRMTIIHEDGRTFLSRSHNKYDVIFIDAFGSSIVPPFQLTTREAISEMADRLNPGGVVMVNEVNSLMGKTGRLLRASYRSFNEVFPQVFLFPVENPKSGDLLQNVMLVALKSSDPPEHHSPDPQLEQMLSHWWSEPIDQSEATLTDELAPIDYLQLDVAKEHRRRMLVNG
jgi:predicted membrane-bound spermidine synthase